METTKSHGPATAWPNPSIALHHAGAVGENHYYRALLRALPDVVLRIGADGTVLGIESPGVATRACLFSGAVGKNLAQVLPEEAAAGFVRSIDEVLGGQPMSVYEYESAENGSPLAYEARIIAYAAHEVLAVVRDATDRRSAEEALARAEWLAALGTLATSLAHELNNPIGAALLSAETILALNADAFPSDACVCLDNIVESLTRCGMIVKRLLTFSKNQPAERHVQDIYALLCRSCDLTRIYAERHNARMELAVPEGLPPVQVSPLDLELVLVNIIRNAIESRPDGAYVRISARQVLASIQITIADNGRGMTDEQKGRVFEPFFTSRRNTGGTGLGLHIADRIVREYGGEISIDSSAGEGTSVHVILPLTG